MRLLTGLPHGTYFGVAALVAASLAPPEPARQRGGPGDARPDQRHAGRRAAGGVAGPALGLARGVRAGRRHRARWPACWCAATCPRSRPPHGASPLRELGALARPQVWLTLGIAAIGFGGMFAVFSYIKPLLTEVTGLSGRRACRWCWRCSAWAWWLGNLVGARLADKSLMRTIGWAARCGMRWCWPRSCSPRRTRSPSASTCSCSAPSSPSGRRCRSA